MLVVKIKCGLGNQLFQYAFAKKLAHENNVQLKIDHITGNENDPQGRIYGLNHFNIEESLLTVEQIKKIQQEGRIWRKIIGIFERKLKLYKLSRFVNNYMCPGYVFLNEKLHIFDKSISNAKIKRNTYLEGYWGSEKYFKSIENIIRKEFIVKNDPDKENKLMINNILNTESVCIHIRARRPGSFQNFAILPLEYYSKAIKVLTKKIKNPHFYIFSDDPEQARNTLNLSFQTTLVNINGIDKDYEDLRLMSYCKHNIIVNSTFSWWGAWLNSNPDKIVIAPKKWFKDPEMDKRIKFEDLYPKKWIVL